MNYSTLPRYNSDHNPIMVVCEDSTQRGPVPFRFKKMWCLNEIFKSMVSDCWNSCPTYRGKLRGVVYKLKVLKHKLKIWNHETFGNIHNNLYQARSTLEQIQSDLANLGSSDDRFEAEILAQKSLNEAHRLEHEFLKEKACVKWIHEGDRNTSFFHRIVNSRKANNLIRVMDINGLLCWDQNTIKDHIKDFYEKLFSEYRDNSPNYGIIKDVIPDLVTT